MIIYVQFRPQANLAQVLSHKFAILFCYEFKVIVFTICIMYWCADDQLYSTINGNLFTFGLLFVFCFFFIACKLSCLCVKLINSRRGIAACGSPSALC